ncbi:MAG TPA: pyrroline-5-carboxylate reductase [Turneriella sp.]|nr:pyrroline-5-carboxylate reductase [Turneriella sp.]HNE19470.1 pyrroline-5-carboxylate reductase [Turneriella sp.]HNJ67156.1 pyrroline-5-carboxylate reductase [Turneriella sp.]HNL09770.1 pyrroline-5-carboxylate reductase [Turneriella sp.]HNL54334.1 pyrroline-5-carboxylate reductase [Turneriella sp.]
MKIGIVGLGKMGSALAQALAGKYEITGFEKSEQSVKNLRPSLTKKIRLAGSMEQLVEESTTIIIATKPAQVTQVVEAIPDHRLIISIAAGVALKSIDAARSANGPTIRAMPNTPMMIRRGITAFTGNKFCTEEDITVVRELFENTGEAIYLEQEKLLHAVTGLSGSGPAYVYLFLQNLEDAGVLLGLSRADSRKLAISTVLGSAELVRQSHEAPQQLIHDVTSPGGTTAVALKSLHRHNFPNAVQEAVTAATRRSVELALEAKSANKDGD